MRINIWNGLWIIAVLGHISCSKTKHLLNSGDETQISNVISDEKIDGNPYENYSITTDTINFVYDRPINGFNISVVLMNISDYMGDKIGNAYIYFVKEGLVYTIYHPTFILDESSYSIFTDKKIDTIKYELAPPKYYNENELGQFQEVPFSFFDVDFDGKKELLLRHPTIGQRESNGYCAYKVPQTEDGEFEEVAAISNLQKKKDFPVLDDFTEFDFENKNLIIKYYKGNNEWEVERYFYEKENLIRKE